MISAEAPILFAKACEIFILELTLRAWMHTEENKRRTLQRNDIAMAITKTDVFDFLIDIVPRDDIKETKQIMIQPNQDEISRAMMGSEISQYYYHFAAHQQAALQQQALQQQQAALEQQQQQAAHAGQLELLFRQQQVQQMRMMEHANMLQFQMQQASMVAQQQGDPGMVPGMMDSGGVGEDHDGQD